VSNTVGLQMNTASQRVRVGTVTAVDEGEMEHPASVDRQFGR
jgi:hypothetical protein